MSNEQLYFANVLVAMRCNEIFMGFEVHGVFTFPFFNLPDDSISVIYA